MHILVVTPMHNEAENVVGVHSALSAQTFKDFTWVVVDDGSADGTARALDRLSEAPVPRIISRDNDGGLIAGSAYSAWRHGVRRALESTDHPYTHVMKLDADVRLPPQYFETILAHWTPSTAVAGGVIVGSGMREQAHHVPGPVKLYAIDDYRSLDALPSAIGFDVMDEIAVTQKGRAVTVVREAQVSLARAIGASEGGVHGRYRNGRVCRWTGYDPIYFLFHALRYAARRPFLIGSLAMLVGYVRASSSPYSADLRRAHAQMQRKKLQAAVRAPRKWLRETYGY